GAAVAESTSDSPNGQVAAKTDSHVDPHPSVNVPAQRSGQLDDEPTLQVIPTAPAPAPEKIRPGPTLARTRPDAPRAEAGTANMDKFRWRLLLKRLFAPDPPAPVRQ